MAYGDRYRKKLRKIVSTIKCAEKKAEKVGRNIEIGVSPNKSFFETRIFIKPNTLSGKII